MSVVVTHDEPPKDRWHVMAVKGGRMATFLRRIPLCGSQQEALERTRIMLARFPDVAAKFDGWTFFQVPHKGSFLQKVRR